MEAAVLSVAFLFFWLRLKVFVVKKFFGGSESGVVAFGFKIPEQGVTFVVRFRFPLDFKWDSVFSDRCFHKKIDCPRYRHPNVVAEF